jgi:hypothetical protein
MSHEVPVLPTLSIDLKVVLLLERLREVNALIGYTRIEALRKALTPRSPLKADICMGLPEWVPAVKYMVRGYLFDSKKMRLENGSYVKPLKKETLCRSGHVGGVMRKLRPDQGYPGIRYTMLHTCAHILIRELAWSVDTMQQVFGKGLCEQ